MLVVFEVCICFGSALLFGCSYVGCERMCVCVLNPGLCSTYFCVASELAAYVCYIVIMSAVYI